MKDTWQMFNKIAPRYDTLNHLLSGYIDHYWRFKLGKKLPVRDRLTVLDVATGTGDVGLSLLNHRSSKVSHVVGIDLAENMLEIAQKKIEKLNEKRMVIRKGDAMNIPFPNELYDVCTIAFGIRNVPDMQKALDEMFRILKPGGRLLILEFSLPKFFLMKWLYLLYFRFILPTVGGWISGDKEAYKYLNTSVEAFPSPEVFSTMISKSGFYQVQFSYLSCGIVSLYSADKPHGK